VIVGSYLSGFYDGTGSYLLTLGKGPGAVAVSAGDEGGPMTNGATHAATIYLGDLDTWTFTATQGNHIALSMGTVTPASAHFAPWIRLVSPTGALLGNSSTGAATAQITATAPTSGTYTVIAGSYLSGFYDGTGSYVLRVDGATASADYTLALEPAALTIAQGATGGATVTITRTNFTGAVTLSLGNAPTGVTGSFAPAAPTGTTSTLTVSVGAAVPPGVYNLTVDGTATAGNRSTSLTLTVSAAGGSGVTVDAGGYHSCALEARQAFCWGNNRGQLGDGTMPDRLVPTAVAGGLTFATLSAGDGASCGLTLTGAAYCWGFNTSGQLGDGTTTDRLSPTPVAGGLTFAALSAGNNAAGGHTCGVTTSGAAYCWGRNGNGQLGDGTTTDRLVPTPVTGGVAFAAVITGGQHTCGVTTSGAAYCWGFNGAGGLGDGTTTQRLVPTLVAGGLTFAGLSAGAAHTCGVTPTGVLYCWGFNGSGQVGDNTLTQRLVPTPVGGGLTFAGVSTGFGHTCGVTTTGTAQCWGFNGQGELGDGTTTERHVPTLVAGGLSFAAVSAGSQHTCGGTTSGVVYCWGLNGNGQVGDGTVTTRLIPAAVALPGSEQTPD